MLSHPLFRCLLMAVGALTAFLQGEHLLGVFFAALMIPEVLRKRPAVEDFVPVGPEAPVAPSLEPDLAALSHELKAPLVGILGLSRILSETSLDSEQSELAAGIVRSSENLGGLLDTLMDSARLKPAAGSAAPELKRESVDLLGLRDDLLGPMRAAFKGPNVALESEVRLGGQRYLMGDPQRLRQIGGNLLTNALKFTAKGEVTLRMTVVQGPRCPLLRLSVSDTGTGIAPDRLGAVLERFEQEHSGIQNRFGGTGLGLSIVKTLTEAMGGELTVSSIVGLGSTFTAEIPMDLPPAPLLGVTAPATARPVMV